MLFSGVLDVVVAQAEFPEQATTDVLAQNVFYWVATMAVVLAIGAFVLVDIGLVRRKNVLDTAVQKMIAALIGGLSFAVVGYGIWEWQFLNAFGVDNPLWQGIKDWWIGGTLLTQFSRNIDPAVAPNADVLQIFLPFNIAFAAVICAFVHSLGLERMKPAALYIMSAIIGGVIFPFILYLTWGSLSPLTNSGVKDYVGVFPLYVFVGVWGLVLVARLGPRIGAFRKDPRVGPVPHNLGLTAAGVTLFLFAIPLFALGCGYWVEGEGYFGIAMASSGFGIALTNAVIALAAGALGGAILAYATRNLVIALVAPLAGYISGAAAFDAIFPWQMALIAFFAPIPVYLVYRWMVIDERLDERKVIPLALGAGLYGLVVTAFVMWANGTPSGGYFGLEGTFAFQNAEVTPWWQLIGIAVTGGITAISALIVVIGLEKTVGLRVDRETEIRGLDWKYWDAPGVTTGDEPDQPTLAQLLEVEEAGVLEERPTGHPTADTRTAV